MVASYDSKPSSIDRAAKGDAQITPNAVLETDIDRRVPNRFSPHVWPSVRRRWAIRAMALLDLSDEDVLMVIAMLGLAETPADGEA